MAISKIIEPGEPACQKPVPPILTKKIGSITYEVSVHFSNTSEEDINDKIIRLIKNDM